MDNLDQAREFSQRVIRQFSGTLYPGDGNIISHPCGECNRVANVLRGQEVEKWANKPLELLMGNVSGSYLDLLTPEAFHYFLPLSLLAAINSFYDADVFAGDLISLFQSPKRSTVASHKYAQFMAKLSLDQLVLLRDIFDWLFTQYGTDASGSDIARDSVQDLLDVRGKK